MTDRVWGLLVKEFRQIVRDPRMVRVIVVAPVLQLVVFGYAVSTDLRDAATVVVDLDRTRASRELVAAFTASGSFEVVLRSDRPSDLVRALDRGEAIVGLEIPRGFAARLGDGAGAAVQLLVDGTNSNTGAVAQSYAQGIIRSHAERIGIPSPPVVDFRLRPWYNPNLSSRDYNVPAVVGALILLVCLLLTALAVVREREIGTLEQLRVSPLRAVELIAGKTAPFALIGLADLTLVTGLGIFWFGVPFRGSVVLLLLASVLYLLSGLGLGLLLSTVSRTQQEAFLGSFLLFMPTILLSGFMFPVSSMPDLFRWLTVLNPMRHYIEIVRAVFLKGTGLAVLWPQFVALLILGAALLGLAARRLRAAMA